MKKATELEIGRRTILIEPELPFSGMTFFEENGFVLGKAAFESKEEMIKTVLHELYRIENSARGANSAARAAEETKNAYYFAEKIYSKYFDFRNE
ncbi:MAG: hypothetical protein JST19_22155 [Bacteroidetes bacterium]|nr:hypothetical protein [Bacteroidota bacterium]